MKKVDLHMHTVATPSDSHFTFCLDKLKDYVTTAELDAIAVTNHNTFDNLQFQTISEELPIPVFPGIEINLEKCHVLLIASTSVDLDDFSAMADKVTAKISNPRDSISFEEMKSIFGDLDRFLIIPHYDKKPAIHADTLARMRPYVSAGEVDSAKKFLRAAKDDSKLTPVLFSDARIHEGLSSLPVRQTFLDCGDITIDAIKTCLKDKQKVCLSREDGNRLFQILANGQMISTGLNVFLGARSSGKTFTLNAIHDSNDSIKYIKQFSLVQQDDDETYKRDFENDLDKKKSRFSDDYLKDFKSVLDDVIEIDLAENERRIEEYVATLLKSAEELDRRDAYSRAALYNETAFPTRDDKTLRDLIESVRQVIENIDHRSTIERHLAACRFSMFGESGGENRGRRLTPRERSPANRPADHGQPAVANR